MDLSALGITAETIKAEIIAKAVDEIVRLSVYGSTDDHEDESPTFALELDKQVRAKVDETIKAQVDRIGAEMVEPKVSALIEAMTFQETNTWGEPKKPAKTWREMLLNRAESWLQEQVDYAGKAKGNDSYGWRPNTTRIAYLVDQKIQFEIEASLKKALADINSQIASGLANAVKLSLTKALEGLKVGVSTR